MCHREYFHWTFLRLFILSHLRYLDLSPCSLTVLLWSSLAAPARMSSLTLRTPRMQTRNIHLRWRMWWLSDAEVMEISFLETERKKVPPDDGRTSTLSRANECSWIVNERRRSMPLNAGVTSRNPLRNAFNAMSAGDRVGGGHRAPPKPNSFYVVWLNANLRKTTPNSNAL